MSSLVLLQKDTPAPTKIFRDFVF